MARFTILRGLSALSLLLLLATVCFAEGESTTYVNGTVSGIPADTEGRLDLGDSEALRFHHGADSVAVPYGRIVNFHLGREGQGVGSKISGGASSVGRTVLPMFFSDEMKYLTIEFETEDGNPQSMVLQLPAYDAKAALPVLEARTAEQKTAAAAAGAPVNKDPEWWGDRVWRTNRNKHLWPERPEENKQETEEAVEVAISKE